ncbi:SH3 domain-binding protein 5 homolog [Tetranychus urticae]|uniref:SH3 domain-binding protein 5 homolog n=1 Tax=Tetranychus urticae TaxID=32264 RepID=T1KJY9_TETUR|nr:SH3 domain-binding protein 5 homolog [Tetranychus urticae]
MNQNADGKFMEETDHDSSANLDPRIGMRLEDLNKWTGKINALEKSFEEANSNFRLILNESTDRLKSLASKLGKSIEESRPYYEAKEKLIEVQIKCQRAAINYEKACQAYLEAKDRIKLAEKKFASASNEFDTTWQEMLNQANIKLMEAETMKKQSERIHQQSMKDFHSAEIVVFKLEKKLKGALQRSKIYFDEKRRFQEQLALVKEEIELTISQINCSKARYAATLKELEAISEEIHEKRNCSILKHLKREPGVGAEYKPDMLTLDSCKMLSPTQLDKFDLQISETFNCQQTEHFESSDNDSHSQASTSDAINYTKDSHSLDAFTKDENAEVNDVDKRKVLDDVCADQETKSVSDALDEKEIQVKSEDNSKSENSDESQDGTSEEFYESDKEEDTGEDEYQDVEEVKTLPDLTSINLNETH